MSRMYEALSATERQAAKTIIPYKIIEGEPIVRTTPPVGRISLIGYTVVSGRRKRKTISPPRREG